MGTNGSHPEEKSDQRVTVPSPQKIGWEMKGGK